MSAFTEVVAAIEKRLDAIAEELKQLDLDKLHLTHEAALLRQAQTALATLKPGKDPDEAKVREPVARFIQARVFRRPRCVVCGEPYDRTGPRQSVCETCRAIAPKAPVERLKLLYGQRRKVNEQAAAVEAESPAAAEAPEDEVRSDSHEDHVQLSEPESEVHSGASAPAPPRDDPAPRKAIVTVERGVSPWIGKPREGFTAAQNERLAEMRKSKEAQKVKSPINV